MIDFEKIQDTIENYKHLVLLDKRSNLDSYIIQCVNDICSFSNIRKNKNLIKYVKNCLLEVTQSKEPYFEYTIRKRYGNWEILFYRYKNFEQWDCFKSFNDAVSFLKFLVKIYFDWYIDPRTISKEEKNFSDIIGVSPHFNLDEKHTPQENYLTSKNKTTCMHFDCRLDRVSDKYCELHLEKTKKEEEPLKEYSVRLEEAKQRADKANHDFAYIGIKRDKDILKGKFKNRVRHHLVVYGDHSYYKTGMPGCKWYHKFPIDS